MKHVNQIAVVVVASMVVGAAITYLAMPGSMSIKADAAEIRCYSGERNVLVEDAVDQVTITRMGHLRFKTPAGEQIFVSAPCQVRTLVEYTP